MQVQLLSILISAAAVAPGASFAVVGRREVTTKRARGLHRLNLSKPDTESEEQATTYVSSVFNKVLAFDDKTGAFYETGYGEGDCIPEDEFCVIDKDTGDPLRLTLEEKERIFLDALQAYYSTGRKLLADDEFDMLKEDLQWNGSEMVVMNKKEVNYMTAMQEYLKGTPVMTDKEFDKLKQELKEEGSRFAVDREPKCYIDTGICKVNHEVDNFRTNLLYLPVGAAVMFAWLLLGYELLGSLIKLNPVLLALVGLPWIYPLTKYFTEEYVFVNQKVVFGPCPSCNFQTRTYFGDILGVEGFDDVASVKCPNCRTQFSIMRNTLRASTIPPSESQ